MADLGPLIITLSPRMGGEVWLLSRPLGWGEVSTCDSDCQVSSWPNRHCPWPHRGCFSFLPGGLLTHGHWSWVYKGVISMPTPFPPGEGSLGAGSPHSQPGGKGWLVAGAQSGRGLPPVSFLPMKDLGKGL